VRIRQVRIKNFRAFRDETFVLDPYTCLVGANGAGKSTLLCALNIFFRESTNSTPVEALTVEDFHQKRTEDRVEITVTFSDLSDAAKVELVDYVRNDELIVSAIAEYDEAKAKAPVRQVGSRLGLPDFIPFFDAYKANVSAANLNAIFDGLKRAYPNIGDGRSKDAKRDALHAFESDPTNADRLVPIESEDQFYGIAGPSKLKPHIQWVYVPAVKDASEEQAESRDGALGKLLARTVRGRVNFKEQLFKIEEQAQQQYSELLEANQAALDVVAASLSARLSQWSHPDVNLKLAWANSPISIREPNARVIAGEQGFEGDIARFGHGFQRSYLLALLQELAAVGGGGGPSLVLGVEEPELYQHPPQARYLSQTLQTIALAGSQVLLTTHSPHFIGGSSFESVRLVRKGGAASTALSVSFSRYAERYADADGSLPRKPTAVEVQINEVLRANLNEMFFATKLVLVEGSEDVAYLMTWVTLRGKLPGFRSQGIHVVAVDGKENLPSPLIIAQELGIPTYVVFDGDRSQSGNGSQQVHNRRIRRLLSADDGDLFPTDALWHEHFVQWPETISNTVDSELTLSLGAECYEAIRQRAMAACGHAPSLSKNTMFIQAKMQLAQEAGAQCPSLDRLADLILL
jgi:putative ATP-dependent endonuclease of the OLD family